MVVMSACKILFFNSRPCLRSWDQRKKGQAFCTVSFFVEKILIEITEVKEIHTSPDLEVFVSEGFQDFGLPVFVASHPCCKEGNMWCVANVNGHEAVAD